MERELCLFLDEKGYYRLVLRKGNSYEIDKYTSRFEDTLQIREKFEKEISSFLNLYKERLNNPNYKGRIVTVVKNKVGSNYIEYRRGVLLKKHIVTFSIYIKNRDFLLKFVNYEKNKTGNPFTEEFQVRTRQRWTRFNGVKTFIDNWLKEAKVNGVYYDIVREFLSFYEHERLYYNLPSYDDLYAYKKQGLAVNEPINLAESDVDTLDRSVIMDGVRYSEDERVLFDLDDKPVYNGFMPDGLGKNDRRTK